MKLHHDAAAAGVRLALHRVLDSTNAHALLLARGGERGPLWIAAEQQTQGRGRAGRRWVSEAGNLHATLLLTAPGPVQHWPQLSFVAGLAVHDAVVEIAGELKDQLAIKWPNDLMLKEAKLGGVLIETESSAAKAVAIGIGVNCLSHPCLPDYPTTDLAYAGISVSPARLFTALSKSMLVRLAQWNSAVGFCTVRSDWLARAMGIGTRISVRAGAGILTGDFETINDRGNLLLRLPDGGISAISTGDVIRVSCPPPSLA
jgi:BirA family transcriptional regulator, biotin operon repressor / biotin---[acetyl-CoA-carboxylase] ligase